MKHRNKWKIACIVVVFLFMQVMQVQAASAPKLNKTKVTLSNKGDMYSLEVKNKKSGWKYSWSSSNKKIVTVNKYGQIKAVKGGNATVRCKITYKSKKTKVLTCKVTVRIPATDIAISNKKLTANNCQTIKVGEQYDFNRKLTPSTATDTVYWQVEDASIATVNSKGVVTAHKQGLTRLKVIAATSSTKAKKSIVNDAINLYVVDNTAEVISVTQSSASVVQIAFSEPINPDTVFNVDGSNTLLDNISFLAKEDDYGKLAQAYGKITGEFSSDCTLLTLTSQYSFKGTYQISIRNLGTKSKKLVDEYVRTTELIDTVPPKYVDTTVDETGTTASINFSEPLNISKLTVESVSRADGITMNVLSTAVLKNKSMYTLSSDKRSILVNMSNINTNDKNKLIYVLVKGIQDIAENDTDPEAITMQVFSDTTTKPQANLLTLERTSYYTITATFDRPIEKAGTLYVNYVECKGVVNSKNKKVVQYTIPAGLAILRGEQSVTISNYCAYNVALYSGYTTVTRKINFTIQETQDAPKLVDYTTDSATNMIILNYSKNVRLANSRGNLSASITTTYPNTTYTWTTTSTIPYMAVVEDNVVKIILDSDHMQTTGTYVMNIPPAFVTDENDVPNTEIQTVALVKTEATKTPSSNPLPAPSSIQQSLDDNNVVNVTFDHKLDIDTATKVTNYAFDGGVIIDSATLLQNDPMKAVVQLHLIPATILTTGDYKLTIYNLLGYNNSYGSIESTPMSVRLKENNPPTMINATLTSSTTIVLNFTEDMRGSVTCTVYQNGNIITQSGSPAVSGQYVTINLATALQGTTGVYVHITSNLSDSNGNAAIVSDSAIAVQ